MGIRFSADEVFEMAERIEDNAAEFYRRAAGLQAAGRRENVDFLRRLAEMEERHKATFAAMRAELPARMKEETAADPMDELSLYLGQMADTSKGEGSAAAAAALTGKESMTDILRTAIGLERQSILLYVGMKDMVPAKLGRDRIDRIIAEEKDHVVVLARELNARR